MAAVADAWLIKDDDCESTRTAVTLHKYGMEQGTDLLREIVTDRLMNM